MTSPAKYWCILQLKGRLPDDIIYEINKHVNWVNVVFKDYDPMWNQFNQVCWLRGVQRKNCQVQIYNDHGWRVKYYTTAAGHPTWITRYHRGKKVINSSEFSEYEFLKLIDKNINFMKIPFPDDQRVRRRFQDPADACRCAIETGDIEMIEFMMENHRHLVADALFGNYLCGDTTMTDYLIKIRKQFVFTGVKLRHIDDYMSSDDDGCITFSDDSDLDSDSYYDVQSGGLLSHTHW